MSTRSLTHIHDSNGKTLLTFYRQSDGYPEGLGAELAAFLHGLTIVNGISDRSAKIANGMGCLAAQLIANLKDGPGGVYIYPVDSGDCGEEYVYRIKGAAGKPVTLEVWEAGFGERKAKLLFEGEPADVAAQIKAAAEKVEA